MQFDRPFSGIPAAAPRGTSDENVRLITEALNRASAAHNPLFLAPSAGCPAPEAFPPVGLDTASAWPLGSESSGRTDYQGDAHVVVNAEEQRQQVRRERSGGHGRPQVDFSLGSTSPFDSAPAKPAITARARGAGHDPSMVRHDVTPMAQGRLYGSAACVPTSASMVMGYYQGLDPALRSATPEQIIKMLDPGDGTPGKGMGFRKIQDELATLGYESRIFKSNLAGLKRELSGGPMIASLQVGLISHPERSIKPGGPYLHAVVVTSMDDNTVTINDPWGGKEMVLSHATFEKMWKGGGSDLFAIRPKQSAALNSENTSAVRA